MGNWPRPWKFEWESFPTIYASNGMVVCTLSTGTLDGPHEVKAIIALAKEIIGNNK